ncbi:MAG: preprotein translocase subunit SecE [Patescibacteria group bacterium]|nr:preprotein translocase subunit SecE [Patescibacteria group bacterium]
MSLINKITDYFSSAKNELVKVTWPTRQDTLRYAGLVIAISVCVAAFFGLLDVGLSNVVTTALANKKIETSVPAEVPVTPTVEQNAPETTTQQPTINFDQATPITTPTDNSSSVQN